MFFCVEFLCADFHPVHLTDAHRRVPAEASKAEVAIGQLEDDRGDDQEGENPDEDTAYHDCLGGQGVNLIVAFESHLWRFGDPHEGAFVAEDVDEACSQGYSSLYQPMNHFVQLKM